MPDGGNVTSDQQRRIDVSDDDELHFWMREFGVSAGELFEAVSAVGSSVRFVEGYLSDRSFPRYAWRKWNEDLRSTG
jgi:hypothetical protein